MEDMRERILDATLRCLDRSGLANASLSEICQEAKISRGALYVHFASKSEILCCTVARATERWLTVSTFHDVPTLRDFLVAEYDLGGVDLQQGIYVEMELLAAARTDLALREAVRQSSDARADMIRVSMAGLQAKGHLRAGLSSEIAAHLVGCFLDGIFVHALGDRGDRKMHIAAVNTLLAGLLTPKALKSLPP
ncbi:TetR/AcrR family transcriptional regulator [Roseateles toxinivorans]|nr:TetR/AcrR family transcriptional regulator [Roseateles toxinivorans]